MEVSRAATKATGKFTPRITVDWARAAELAVDWVCAISHDESMLDEPEWTDEESGERLPVFERSYGHCVVVVCNSESELLHFNDEIDRLFAEVVADVQPDGQVRYRRAGRASGLFPSFDRVDDHIDERLLVINKEQHWGYDPKTKHRPLVTRDDINALSAATLRNAVRDEVQQERVDADGNTIRTTSLVTVARRATFMLLSTRVQVRGQMDELQVFGFTPPPRSETTAEDKPAIEQSPTKARGRTALEILCDLYPLGSDMFTVSDAVDAVRKAQAEAGEPQSSDGSIRQMFKTNGTATKWFHQPGGARTPWLRKR